MIKGWRAKNYQCHKDTFVSVVPGLNAIVGSSDQGKSALLRNLLWPITGDFGGDSKASNWIKDSKKKIKKSENMSAEIILDDDTVITRTRDKTGEKWTMNDQLYAATGGKVPEPIAEKLHMESVNIQKQLDSPFFLSLTSGERARYLNSVVHLESMDNAQSTMESKKRQTNGKLRTCDFELSEEETKLASYDWLEEAAKEVSLYEAICSRVDSLEDNLRILERLIQSIEDIDTMDWMEGIEGAFRSWYMAEQEKDQADNSFWDLGAIVDAIENIDEMDWMEGIDSFFKEVSDSAFQAEEAALAFKHMDELIGSIELVNVDETDWQQALVDLKEVQAVTTELKEIEGSIDDLSVAMASIVQFNEQQKKVFVELGEAEKHFLSIRGEACPTCGKPW